MSYGIIYAKIIAEKSDDICHGWLNQTNMEITLYN